MSEKKIVIPEGMLDAAVDDHMYRWKESSCDLYRASAEGAQEEATVRESFTAAFKVGLRWLSEHPIAPTEAVMKECEKGWLEEGGNRKGDFFSYVLLEWQRRMFLEPEPDIPKSIADLVHNVNGDVESCIVEAYRRGKAEA